jgi:hypothetical protein
MKIIRIKDLLRPSPETIRVGEAAALTVTLDDGSIYAVIPDGTAEVQVYEFSQYGVALLGPDLNGGDSSNATPPAEPEAPPEPEPIELKAKQIWASPNGDWAEVFDIREEGRTVLYTLHYAQGGSVSMLRSPAEQFRASFPYLAISMRPGAAGLVPDVVVPPTPEPAPPPAPEPDPVALLAEGKRLRFVRDADNSPLPEVVEGAVINPVDGVFLVAFNLPGEPIETNSPMLFCSDWNKVPITTAEYVPGLISRLGYRFAGLADQEATS